MNHLQVAVVGAGHLGGIHARLLAQQEHADLVAIVDPDAKARQRIAAATGVPATADLVPILPRIDAAIVAAPTFLHHTIGHQLLACGKHVLMEKPLAPNRVMADSLLEEARRHGCILQVGHVERFNPAMRAVEPIIDDPKYIESRRLTGFSFRSMDIGVVMDLMIHDLDLILHLVPGDVTSVQALGASVLGGHEDMAQARLVFSNGCVANLTASRTSATAERSMNVFCDHMHASIDFADRSVQVVRPRRDILDQSFRADEVPLAERQELRENLFAALLRRQSLKVADGNPLVDEQTDFITAIQQQRQPRVSGLAGRNAVALAEQICDAIESHCWDGEAGLRTGPHALEGPTIPFPPAASQPTPALRRKAG